LQGIVGEFGKALEQSMTLMKKLGQLWDDYDNYNNDDGHPPSSGAGEK
jgi:hypothetical protein